MKCIAKKSYLLISLMLLSSCQAQPTRDQRQLKSPAGATEADVKMMTANMTPATSPMQLSMSGMPINQMSLQMARYPGYSGLAFGGGPGSAASFLGGPGLQTNIANNYPGYPSDPSLGLGYGLGLGGYPGNPQSSGFMYGNPMYGNPLYGNPQLGNGNVNGFGPQPGVDNFGALNNIINMANAQGLGAGVAGATGLYPQGGVAGVGGLAGVPGVGGAAGFGGVGGAAGFGGVGGVGGVGMPIPGYFGGHGAGVDGINMHHYAPAF